MLLDDLQNDLRQAMKKHEKDRVSVLRLLLSELHNLEIDKRTAIVDADIRKLIQKQMRQRKEAIEHFKRGGRADLVVKEDRELKILAEYLPEMLGEEDVRHLTSRVIEELGAGGLKDLGRVMGRVMTEVEGKADGALVNAVARELLG